MQKRGKLGVLVVFFALSSMTVLLLSSMSAAASNSGTGCWSDGACGDVNLKSDTCYYDTY
jgi:hypothetical protein